MYIDQLHTGCIIGIDRIDQSIVITLYKVFLIISMFISSKSCSDMHSTKNGAKEKMRKYQNINMNNKL